MPSVRDLIPDSPKDRTKMFVILGLFAVVLIFLATQLPTCRRTAEAPDSAGWTAALDLEKKLMADPEFIDTGVSVLTERPLRLVVRGSVKSQKELDRLNDTLKQLRPDNDYDVEVEIVPK